MEGYSRKPEANHRTKWPGGTPLWLLLLWALATAAQAAPHVQVVLSSDKDYYRQTASFIRETFQQQYPGGQFARSLAGNSDWPAASSQLVVAVGSGACEVAMARVPDTALLCTFLPRSTYQWLAASKPAAGQRSAIYFDQPLFRYMAMIRVLAPATKNLGTAVGPVSRQLLPDIQRLADSQGLTLHPVELQSDVNPLTALSAVVEKSDAFLVNPDRASLNKAVANWLLRLSIRQQIPVIAYSRNYVNAGALAAVYSSPENIGRDTGEAINSWFANPGQRLEPPRYPKYFAVSSNPRVARALGIKLPRDKQLIKAINRLSGPLNRTP